MPDPRTDRIAHEAARLIGLGRAGDIGAAIRSAAEALGLADARMPSHGRVRRHSQAMSMQAMGEAAYVEAQKKALSIAEEIMAGCEHAIPNAEALLVGRTAQGQIDIGAAIHIRLYTDATIPEIAQALVDLGYAEPTFHTIDTRHGRLNQVRLIEEGVEIALMRCLPELRPLANVDLISGKRIAMIGLSALRRRIENS